MYSDFAELAAGLPVIIPPRLEEPGADGVFHGIVGDSQIVAFTVCVPPHGCLFTLTIRGSDCDEVYRHAVEQLGAPEQEQQVDSNTRQAAWTSEKSDVPDADSILKIGREEFDAIIQRNGLRKEEILPVKEILIVRQINGDGLMGMMAWMRAALVCVANVAPERRVFIMQAQSEVYKAYKSL